MALTFKKAVTNTVKLKLCLAGASGSGKTYSALILASVIGKKVAVIDTENGSASLYARKFEQEFGFSYDVLELPAPYSPERFIQCIKGAEQLGYDLIVLDSITHEWSGVGGCLEMQQKATQADPKGNSYTAWAKVTPQHDSFINAMVSSPCHIIATMRSKTNYEISQEQGQRAKVVKQGTAPIQRDGIEYEFTLVLDLNQNHYANASKDRTGLFDGKDFIPSADTAKELLGWLNGSSVETKAQVIERYQTQKESISAQNEIDQAVDHMERDMGQN
jgi:hypothetical protein